MTKMQYNASHNANLLREAHTIMKFRIRLTALLDIMDTHLVYTTCSMLVLPLTGRGGLKGIKEEKKQQKKTKK